MADLTYAKQLKILHAEGLWDNELARRLGVCAHKVKRDRERLGLPRNEYSRADNPASPVYVDAKAARKLYDQGLSDWEIGLKLCVDVGKARQWRISEGLKPNKRHEWTDAKLAEARRLYDKGLPDADIAAAVQMDIEAVRQWRIGEGLQPNRRRLLDETEVRRLYDQGKSDIEIARAVSATNAGIQGWRARNGLLSNGRRPSNPGADYDWSQVDALIRSGSDYAEITEQTGISRYWVRKRREELGLKLKRGRQPKPKA